MASWGFTNGHLEPWDFARPVDQRRRRRRDSVAGQGQARVRGAGLDARHGRHGQGQGVQFLPPDRPTKEELEKYLESVKPSVENAIVLVGRSNLVPVNLEPPAKRTADESLRDRFNGVPARWPEDAAGAAAVCSLRLEKAPCRRAT